MISSDGTEYTITYAVAAYSEADAPSHRFQAVTEDGDTASELYVDPDTMVIANVETDPQYRGEGIATALYRAALDQLGTVLHARPAHRTEDGAGWADAVGGDTEDHEDEDVYA